MVTNTGNLTDVVARLNEERSEEERDRNFASKIGDAISTRMKGVFEGAKAAGGTVSREMGAYAPGKLVDNGKDMLFGKLMEEMPNAGTIMGAFDGIGNSLRDAIEEIKKGNVEVTEEAADALGSFELPSEFTSASKETSEGITRIAAASEITHSYLSSITDYLAEMFAFMSGDNIAALERIYGIQERQEEELSRIRETSEESTELARDNSQDAALDEQLSDTISTPSSRTPKKKGGFDIGGVIKGIFDNLKKVAWQAVKRLALKAILIGSIVTPIFKGLWEGIKDYMENGDIKQAIEVGWNQMKKFIVDVFKDIWNMEFVKDIRDDLSEIWDSAEAKWDGMVKWTKENITLPIQNFFTDIKDKFLGIPDTISAAWDESVNWVKESVFEPISNFGTKVKDKFTKVVDDVTAFFDDPIGSIKEFVGEKTDSFTETLSAIVAKPYEIIQDGIASLFEKVGLTGLAEWVESFDIKGNIASVIDGIKNFFSFDWIPEISIPVGDMIPDNVRRFIPGDIPDKITLIGGKEDTTKGNVPNVDIEPPPTGKLTAPIDDVASMGLDRAKEDSLLRRLGESVGLEEEVRRAEERMKAREGEGGNTSVTQINNARNTSVYQGGLTRNPAPAYSP